MSISLLTFDVFGTILDWRRGLREALGGRMPEYSFDRIIDRQGALEQQRFQTYAAIVAQSLVEELGLKPDEAGRIGAAAGSWPLFPDSPAALRRLRTVARCAAITNSDKAHRPAIEKQLGFALDGWICAEDARKYKPDPDLWRMAAERMGVQPGRDWWHVSAYADYDHRTARALGLTCVFVQRPHSRPGDADLVVKDLRELADRVDSASL